MKIRDSLIAALVGALAIGAFLGVIRVMAPGTPSAERGAPQPAAPAAVSAPQDDSEIGESPG